MASVLVTVPTDPRNHWIHKTVSKCLILLVLDERHQVTPWWPSERPYENNLHHIVRDFRKGDWEFWLNIDSDNPPMNNPLDLCELDLDIIGLPTPVWHYTNQGEFPIYLNAYDWDEEAQAYRQHPCFEGLQRVDAVGTGCFLMHRRVVDKMAGPIFQRTYDEDGCVDLGNDLAFCKRAREQGVEIYAHYDYKCRHFSELDLIELAGAING